MINRLLLMFVSLIFVTNVNAAGFTTTSRITQINHGASATYIYGPRSSNPDRCQQSNTVAILNDTSYFKSFYATVLSAKAENKAVRIYTSGCVHTGNFSYPKITAIITQ